MKPARALLLTVLLATPAAAEEENGLSLMERGAQMFMEGILREMEPALEGLDEIGPALRNFAEEMGPALGDVLSKIEDWSRYHPPEILPNGDIILRRKTEEEMQEAAPSEPVDI
jgi:hypothetical protein